MTVCNMSIEMGARGGLVGIDATTVNYVRERVAVSEELEAYWLSLNSDPDAAFDTVIQLNALAIQPMVTTGTSPDTGIAVDRPVSDSGRNSQKGLQYMGFDSADLMAGKRIDHVFIGSCTNGRIEDLRQVAKIARGRRKAEHVTVWVVPGSNVVREQAVAEGLDRIFVEAGFEFREPGCSACLAMNSDKIPSGAICISTSNRNFEGRQGPGARTVLASPATAAASAIYGAIADPRMYLPVTEDLPAVTIDRFQTEPVPTR